MVEDVILLHMYLFSYPKDTKTDYSSMPWTFKLAKAFTISLFSYTPKTFKFKKEKKTK